MKGLLTKIEVLVVVAFILIFIFWAGSRCKETKVQMQEAAIAEAVEDSLSEAKEPLREKTSSPNTLEEALRKKKEELAAAAADSAAKMTAAPVGETATPAEPDYSKLYITIDKLKIRSAPGLKSKVLGELPLFAEVYFLEEVTDSTYAISLGKEIADEPYVKIKTKRGTVGWVYGAGVNYYKKKREGVLE